MDILIEDLDGSLWSVAIDKKNKVQHLEIDPYAEIIRWGSLYMGKVGRIDKSQDAAYIDLGFGFEGILYLKDVRLDGAPAPKGKSIGQVLSPGQMVMVQIKTAINPTGDEEGLESTKASRVSMDIALQGRYLIYTPFAKENRISKRITDKDLRKNLKSMLKNVDDISGCILRASAAHCQTDMLVNEGKILKAIWDNLLEYDGEDEPTLLMMGPNAVQRTIGDLAGQKIDSIALNTNLEAARETARQLRIRNVGGIIMVDFINMKSKSQKDKLLQELERAFIDDPCTAQCHGITELGVFEISRQRRTPTLADKLVMFEAGGEEFE